MGPVSYPWRAPPPNLYRLKPVLGYRNHDYTKKRAPAWSFVRYIPPSKPKPVVSLSPFQKMVMRSIQGKKKKTQNWSNRVEYDTTGGSSRRYQNQKSPKKKRGKNKKRRPYGDDFRNSRKWDKPSEQASSSKDRSRKHPSKRSLASGQFQIPPDDMCDLCFPWAKSKAPLSDDSKSLKKNRRSRSISSNGVTQEPTPDTHSFQVVQPGRFMEEIICEYHGGILIPSGRKIAMERNLPKLPRPPKEESQLTTKERNQRKHSSKSSVSTSKKST